MPAFHSVYGLRLHSNRPIPGLKALPPWESSDAQVWLGPESLGPVGAPGSTRQVVYVSPYCSELGRPILTVSTFEHGAYFEFHYDDGTQFIVDQRGTRIWATWADHSTLADTATYLLGPVLGFVLRRRNAVCLHASAVVMDGQAVALAGPPGAGKSTTAAALAKRGYAVLSDDVVALTDRGDAFLVQPGYPRLCLRPDATSSLYGTPDALPTITPNWDKRCLDLNNKGYRFQQSPCPLAAIYLLGGRRAEGSANQIEAAPPGDALINLVANTYINYLLDSQRRAQEFELLGRLVSRVPVRRLAAGAEPLELSGVCDALLRDFYGAMPPMATSKRVAACTRA